MHLTLAHICIFCKSKGNTSTYIHVQMQKGRATGRGMAQLYRTQYREAKQAYASTHTYIHVYIYYIDATKGSTKRIYRYVYMQISTEYNEGVENLTATLSVPRIDHTSFLSERSRYISSSWLWPSPLPLLPPPPSLPLCRFVAVVAAPTHHHPLLSASRLSRRVNAFHPVCSCLLRSPCILHPSHLRKPPFIYTHVYIYICVCVYMYRRYVHMCVYKYVYVSSSCSSLIFFYHHTRVCVYESLDSQHAIIHPPIWQTHTLLWVASSMEFTRRRLAEGKRFPHISYPFNKITFNIHGLSRIYLTYNKRAFYFLI